MTSEYIKQKQHEMLELSKDYTKEDLDRVLLKNAFLTCDGIESPESKNYLSNRESLRESLKAFQLCCAFLSLCTRSKRVNYRFTNSNYLKHRIEHFMQAYIPSGAIAAAADYLGIRYKTLFKSSEYVVLFIKTCFPITEEMEYAAMGSKSFN